MMGKIYILSEIGIMPLKNLKKSSELEEDFLYRPTTPSKIYIERCEEFLKNPPPRDWNGVWEMKTK